MRLNPSIKRTALVFAGLAAGGLAALLLLTGPVLEGSVRLLAKAGVLPLDPGEVRGNIFSGITVEGLRFDGASAEVRIPKAELLLKPGGLLKGRLVVERFVLQRPYVFLHPLKKPPE